MRPPTAVVFGAGRMACGLVGYVLHQSGYRVVFVARRRQVVDALNRYGGYRLTIAGSPVRLLAVRNCFALPLPERDRVANAVAGADLVLTGVGVDNLQSVTPLIAEGLWRRSQSPGTQRLNVIACENLPGAGAYLRHQVLSAISLDRALAVDSAGGFSAALTRRIMTGGERSDGSGELWFTVSGEPDLVVDVRGLKGVFPQLYGVTLTESFPALVTRKLYTLNCAHAVAAYLGYRHRCEYVHEAARHPQVAPVVEAAVGEAAAALAAEFPFQARDVRRDAQQALVEIATPGLADTIRRVARDPLRKLTPLERLVAPARLAARHGLPYHALAQGIAAALAYDDRADANAQALQAAIAGEGLDHVLAVDCGLLPYEPLARAVKREWLELTSPELQQILG